MQINPPFDDCFDDVEETVLLTLVQAAREFVSDNRKTFSRLRLKEYKRKLRLSITALSLRSHHTDDATTDSYLKKYPESKFSANYWAEKMLWKNVGRKNRSLAFSDVLINEFDKEEMILESDGKSIWENNQDVKREFFKPDFINYCEDTQTGRKSIISQESNRETTDTSTKTTPHLISSDMDYLINDLQVWAEVQKIKVCRDVKERQEACLKIRNNWLQDDKYFFGNINSPATKEEQTKIINCAGGWRTLQKSTPRLDVLNEIQRLVRNRIEA